MLEGSEKTLGKDHPNTIDVVFCLAGLYHKQGKLEDAVVMYQRAMTSMTMTLGDSWLSFPSSLLRILRWPNISLRSYYLLPFCDPPHLSSLIRHLPGEEHPSTIAISVSLAGLLRTLGRVDEAKVVYERVLQVKRRTLGKDHPSTRSTVSALAGMQDQNNQREQILQVMINQSSLNGVIVLIIFCCCLCGLPDSPCSTT